MYNTLIGGAVALVTMTTPLKLAIAAVRQHNVLHSACGAENDRQVAYADMCWLEDMIAEVREHPFTAVTPLVCTSCAPEAASGQKL
jgi:hypothetical protein